jgi:hypothetical protein
MAPLARPTWSSGRTSQLAGGSAVVSAALLSLRFSDRRVPRLGARRFSLLPGDRPADWGDRRLPGRGAPIERRSVNSNPRD